MPPPADQHVTLVEVSELTRPFEEFAAAVRAATRRLEDEGIRELATPQFYADPGSREAGVILTFADRDSVIEHIGMITGWKKFERFFDTVRPLEVRVYGRPSAEAEGWIRQFDAVSRTFDELRSRVRARGGVGQIPAPSGVLRTVRWMMGSRFKRQIPVQRGYETQPFEV